MHIVHTSFLLKLLPQKIGEQLLFNGLEGLITVFKSVNCDMSNRDVDAEKHSAFRKRALPTGSTLPLICGFTVKPSGRPLAFFFNFLNTVMVVFVPYLEVDS